MSTSTPVKEPKMSFCTLKVWDVSTAHITEKDNDLLFHGDCDISCQNLEEGFLIHVPVESEHFHREISKMSGEFRNIMFAAQKENVDYVKFNSMADVNDDYPTFDW